MNLRFLYRSLTFFACIFLLVTPASAQYDFDVLIKGGNVFDGSGDSAFRADIAIKDGMIVKVAKSIDGTAAQVINAKKLHITPGFIDLHSHVDRGMYYPERSMAENYLKQGVTTVVIGQCGTSAWKIFDQAKDQMTRWETGGIGPNAAMLVGHGSVRRIVMGNENREPTPEELAQMKEIVRQAMEQGAAGLSTGLIYRPGSYAKTDEVIELVKVIAPYGGIYHTHIRNEGDDYIEAVQEAIHICEAAGTRLNISHFKAMNERNWGKVVEACRLVEEARARGLKVTADQYPFQFTNNNPYMTLIPRRTWLGKNADKVLQTADIEKVFDYLRDSELIELYNKVSADPIVSDQVPHYIEELPRKDLVSMVARAVVNTRSLQGPANPRERAMFIERMNNPAEAGKIREEVKNYLNGSLPPQYIIIVAVCPERELEGKSLSEAAKIKGKSIEDTAIELALMNTLAVPHRMCEEDIEYILKRDYVATGSDGAGPPMGIGSVHPRSYTTFLHKIKKYAQERKAISVAHAVRSQTSLPASIMQWNDRGWIKEGYKADIAVIDLKNIKTRSNTSDPHKYSEGVEFLLINGEIVIDHGEYTGKLPGKILRLKKTISH